MKKLNFVKTFENYTSKGVDDRKLGDAINVLYNSIRVCPSLKHIVRDMEKIEDMFNVYGSDKADEILFKLKQLEPEINNWDMDDREYLMSDRGVKKAPNSQLRYVLSLLEN